MNYIRYCLNIDVEPNQNYWVFNATFHGVCAGLLQVLALPGLVWKQLSGEEVSWSKDFPAVDSVLVSIPPKTS